MKIILTFLSIIISNFLFAQDNGGGKQNNAIPSVSSAASTDKKSEKKVRYVDKRTKSVQNNRNNSGAKIQKKPLIRKAENPGKVLSK